MKVIIGLISLIFSSCLASEEIKAEDWLLWYKVETQLPYYSALTIYPPVNLYAENGDLRGTIATPYTPGGNSIGVIEEFLIVVTDSEGNNHFLQPKMESVGVLPQYWKVDFETFSFSSEYDGEFGPRPAGYVKIRYLIDSNGNPTHLNVVKSHPAGVWNDQGLLAAEQLQYSPSKKNKTNTPVYVTTEFHFKEIK